jgi:hypothetical protein
MQLHQ